ncbi:uncharacterized protein KQ657_004780 [Scheffersomyces spartinae]|uniref:MINDY deubiquitinase domain-containing protein n=1 Tax=Scheffersomyces spartinae TaxID=45513 RepID=A0A9P8AJE6_9ASCO|nr:uncharacterized protein KQ657_004780 [Scheffersomyces spartinae]KAG7194072.1 hypothetical protein KQ657_004780 [Scheffersomyces spartinae]
MSFIIKKITWSEYQIETPILLQDVNGACPLISIVNTLLMSYGLLQADVILNDVSDLLNLQRERLKAVTALRDRLVEKSSVSLEEIVNELVWLLVEHFNSGNDEENTELVEILPNLNYGLNVNPDITNGLFGNELGTRLFDIFGLKLRHGWIVDPSGDSSELVELAEELKTYDKIQDYLVDTIVPTKTTTTTAAAKAKAMPVSAAPPTNTSLLPEVPVTTTTTIASPVVPPPQPADTLAYLRPTDSLRSATSVYPESTTDSGINDSQVVYTPYTPVAPNTTTAAPVPVPANANVTKQQTPNTTAASATVTSTDAPTVTTSDQNMAVPCPALSFPEPSQSVDDIIKDHESPTGRSEFSPPEPSAIDAVNQPTITPAPARIAQNSVEYKKSVLRSWLDRHSAQLTTHGLDSLRDQCNPGEFLILFRNNHFSTVYKRSDQDLYVLITDSLLQRQIVWQSLNSISGTDDLFFDGDFVPFFESEELQDYLLTKNLQEQEDARLAEELQKRYQKSSQKGNHKTAAATNKIVQERTGNENTPTSSKEKPDYRKPPKNNKDSKCILM